MNSTKVLLGLLCVILFLGHIALGKENCSGNGTSPRLPQDTTIAYSNRTLSRRKRYLTFPKGSAFVATLTLLKAIQIKEPSNWNIDLEFDMIWPIPNHEKPFKRPYKRIKTFHRTRRHKRDLYANIERALGSQGLPGKECVLRTICEANTYLNLPGLSLIEDILRVIFTYEDSGQRLDDYDLAYRKKTECDFEYSCPISLLELLLNYDPNIFG